MNGKRLMEVINSADYDRHYAELNWTGTFEEYLDMVVERASRNCTNGVSSDV